MIPANSSSQGSARATAVEGIVTTLGRNTDFIDVLDRVLDKGIVIEGWGLVSFVGIDLVEIDGWVVVASIETYLRYADSLGLTTQAGTGDSWRLPH